MFGAVLIAPNVDLANYVENTCAASGTRIYRTLNAYPAPFELAQLLNALAPEVFLLQIDPSDKALQIARQIRVTRPETCVIGIVEGGIPEQMRGAENSGVDHTLKPPFTPYEIEETIRRSVSARRAEELGDVLAFLPAKAGSGSSTTALNVAGALSMDCKRKVLLMDADLHSGLLGMLLHLETQKSIIDALEQAQRLDGELWKTLPAKAHGMDVLGTPRAKRVQMFSEWDYLHLLGFARERYQAVIVDLPEIVNQATQAIVREARKVFVVCTPEIPSVFLARRRIFELQNWGVRDSSLGVVLNRCVDPNPTIGDVEKVLQRKVSAVVPNDYFTVKQAIQEARPVRGASDIARAFTSFAYTLTGQSRPADRPGRWLGRLLGAR